MGNCILTIATGDILLLAITTNSSFGPNFRNWIDIGVISSSGISQHDIYKQPYGPLFIVEGHSALPVRYGDH
jgi:hypothetical protein